MKNFKNFLGGALLLTLPLFVTSCEDVLGEWSRPTPQIPVPEPSVTYYVWNPTTNAFEEKTVTGITTLSETTTSWSGVCVVDKDVTIDGDVTATGDVELIIVDGAKLTINGKIVTASDLKIYGQKAQSGQIVVNNTATGNALEAKGLEIGGVVVNVTAPTTLSDFAIRTQGKTVIYAGNVTTTGGHAIFVDGNNLEIYGGTHDLTSDAQSLSAEKIIFAGGTINVTGSQTGGTGPVADADVEIKTTITELKITNSNGITENKMQYWIHMVDTEHITFGENAAIVGSTWNASTIVDGSSTTTYTGFTVSRADKTLTITPAP